MKKTDFQQVAEATVKEMTEKKPKWFSDHEKADERDFGSIKKTLAAQDISLKAQGEMLIESKRAIDDLIKKQDEYHQQTLPVFEYMNEITVGRKIRWDYLKMTGVWTGVILGVSAVGWIVWGIFKFLVFNAK